jgi:adenylate cyclase class 2
MIEAELKARVKDVEAVRIWLRARAEEEEATYHDTYYDWPDRRLDTEGREIRLRIVSTAAGTVNLLTYKQPPVAAGQGSKPENETQIAEPEPVQTMLEGLGLVKMVTFKKNCRNFKIAYGKRHFTVTLVTVPELDGSFIEAETMVDLVEVESAVANIRELFSELGVLEGIDKGSYTDAVMIAQGIARQ